MPRDGNGNYTYPSGSGNPVVSDTVIEANWANLSLQDLATEMTDSLSRSGKGGMIGNFPIVDIYSGLPGLNFSAEPTSGLLREGSGDVRMRILGNDRMRWLATTGAEPEILMGAAWEKLVTRERLGMPAGSAAMPGDQNTTVCYFYNATVPTGWTLNVLDSNIRELVVNQTHGLGGSHDPTNLSATVNTTVSVNLPAATGAHTLSEAEIPAHNHKQRVVQDSGSGLTQSASVDTNVQTLDFTFNSTTENTGGGGSHTHPIGGTAAGTGSGPVAFTPRYASGVLGTLS